MTVSNQAPPHRANGRGHGTEVEALGALGSLPPLGRLASLARNAPFGARTERSPSWHVEQQAACKSTSAKTGACTARCGSPRTASAAASRSGR